MNLTSPRYLPRNSCTLLFNLKTGRNQIAYGRSMCKQMRIYIHDKISSFVCKGMYVMHCAYDSVTQTSYSVRQTNSNGVNNTSEIRLNRERIFRLFVRKQEK